MKLFIAACLLAVSLAQTEAPEAAEGECACVTLPAERGLGDYGSFCSNWDAQEGSPFFEECTSINADWCGTENWCALDWCYVDESCPGAQPSAIEGNEGAFWSYSNCGAPNCYSDPFADGCPYTEHVNCDCPPACIEGWVGDGFCDDGENSLSDCTLCEHFTDVNGLFDGGDCITTTMGATTTGEFPQVVHNKVIIDGKPDCADANGICLETSFRAVNASTLDEEGDNNDYGCIEGIVRTPSWFLFQIDNPGKLQLDVLGDSDIDFVAWGPYSGRNAALNQCGNLPAPIACSNAGSSREVLTIESTSKGDVYVLLISDYASFFDNQPTIVTIRNTTEMTASLDCAITGDSEEQCVATSPISINFTNAEVIRANLAQKADPSQDGGIYYKGVGEYEFQKMGLFVTTSTPENYGCTPSKCDQVLTTNENEGRFGQINMKPFGTIRLKFQYRFDDPSFEIGKELADGETIDRIAMTVLDIDSGIQQGEAVTFIKASSVCPGGISPTNGRLFLDPNNGNELDFDHPDNSDAYRWNVNTGCYVSNSDPPTGSFIVRQFDTSPPNELNPTNPNAFTAKQLSVTVQAEWVDVDKDGYEMDFTVSRSHATARNMWFSGQSSQIGIQCCRDVVICSQGQNYKNGNQQCTLPFTANTTNPCNENFCCEEKPSSHGDPIIWTFHGECYDLSADGNYLASSHYAHNHNVKVAVYNEYMRQISVTNLRGDIVLAIDNFGNVLDNGWPFMFEQETVPCPEDYDQDDCQGEFKITRFDAQDFRWVVHSGLRHNYNDQALSNGKYGYHLDIYPKPFNRYFHPRRDEYTGLYFHNPLPEELPTCENRKMH